MITLQEWELRPQSTSTVFTTNPKGRYGLPVLHRPGCWNGMPNYPTVFSADHKFDVLQAVFESEQARAAADQPHQVEFCQSCMIRKRET